MAPSCKKSLVQKRALIVLTNISKLPGKDAADVCFTGFDARAVAHLWSLLKVRNFYQIDYCTPEGGPAPLDPRSADESKDDPIVQSFLQNKTLVDTFQDTMSAKSIVESMTEYSLIGLVGAHGALIDVAASQDIAKLVTIVYEQNGLICAIGHGLCGALCSQTSLTSFPGIPLLKEKKVTSSTRSEDEQQTAHVPFFLDERLMALGAWVLNKGPFEINVCIDYGNDETGKIVTGQNTASVPAWIELIETLIIQ